MKGSLISGQNVLQNSVGIPSFPGALSSSKVSRTLARSFEVSLLSHSSICSVSLGIFKLFKKGGKEGILKDM